MRRLFLLLPISLAVAGIFLALGIHPMQAADQAQVNTTSEATGVSYITLRPGISGTVETIVLRLNNDGSATLTTDSNVTNEPPVTESGTWSESGEGAPAEAVAVAAVITDTSVSTETTASAAPTMSTPAAAITSTVTVTLTAKDGVDYDAPVVLTFQKYGETLTALGAEDRYGPDGLTLRLASAAASSTNRSLINIDLNAGFPLDPTFMSVNGGGEVDVSLLADECNGFVNPDPVVTVDWSGQTDFVRAFYVSDSDSSLVVVAPDGKVLCSDDTSKLILDPTIQIDNPISGTYRIWIGSVAKNQLIPGILVLTAQPDMTLANFDMASFIKRPKFGLPPVPPEKVDADKVAGMIQSFKQGTTEISASTGTITAAVVADGIVPVFQLLGSNPDCTGLINAAPSFSFHWTGTGDQLNIMFEGDDDSSLIVYGADGEVVACNDDSAPSSNINPAVTIEQPVEGSYGVWVGRLDPARPISGTLTITTEPDAEPALLAPDGSR